MRLAIILSTKHAETNWNALRLANLATSKGDNVSVFLTGEGVEYDKDNSMSKNSWVHFCNQKTQALLLVKRA